MSRSQSSPLLDEVRTLLTATKEAYAGSEHDGLLGDVEDRLEDALRVAIAGKVKAGKSTLLNAMVGDELAPTDAGECTRIVTWYRHGIVYKVMMTPYGGRPIQVPFTRDAGAIEVDLGSRVVEDIEELTVEWPVRSLETMTLIDTPGIGSLSTDVSARSVDFLAPDDEQTTPSDAVVYLMRHLHAGDVQFLHAFHEEEYAQPSPVNCVAVLSRADEIAVGRLDAMDSAHKIASRYSGDSRLRRLVQRVVPVAGLLAQAGASLRELDFRRIQQLGLAPESDVSALFLSTDRFIHGPTGVELDQTARAALLDRFGLYGVKLGSHLVRTGQVSTATELADELVKASGIDDLREVLLTLFAGRSETLKARSALLAIERLIEAAPNEHARALGAQLERVHSGAHEFAELRLLNLLRAGELPLKADQVTEIELLFGSRGTSLPMRLGMDPFASHDEITEELFAVLAQWRRRAESPMSSQPVVQASHIVTRTCERLYGELAARQDI